MLDIDPKIFTGILAIITAVLGGIFGAVTKGYSSRQKIKEMQYAYETKLKDGYLEKAREYLGSVYIPLSVSLSQLNNSYHTFRIDNSTKASHLRLKKEIQKFLDSVSEQGEKGANAFLTTELDESLQSYCHFLRASLNTNEPKAKIILRTAVKGVFNMKNEYYLTGKKVKILESGVKTLGINMRLGSFLIESSEILAAPIESKDFEKRFITNGHYINTLVKEVTLGSKARD